MFNEAIRIERKIDIGLNILGVIPGVGIGSGYFRAQVYGVSQLFIGKLLTVIGAAGVLFGNDRRHWENIMYLGIDHLIHGALSIITGIGEMFLAMTPFSLILLAFRYPTFEPIIDYRYSQDNFSYYCNKFNRKLSALFA